MGKPTRKRGRPPVDPWVISLIANRVEAELGKPEDERVQAKQMADEIHKEIRGKVKIAVSTLEKKVQGITRKLIEKSDLLNKPWSMATLNEFPISPEAIPVVLQVWKFRVANEQSFSICEAQWVARLSGVEQNIKKLSEYATRYARLELMYHLIDRPLNTTQLDRQIMGIPYSITSRDGFEGFLPLLTGQDDAVEQIKDLKQGKRKGITIGREQPSLTKTQILEKSANIRRRALRQKQDWDDYIREHRTGGTK